MQLKSEPGQRARSDRLTRRLNGFSFRDDSANGDAKLIWRSHFQARRQFAESGESVR